jgi:hypothetical protein
VEILNIRKACQAQTHPKRADCQQDAAQ